MHRLGLNPTDQQVVDIPNKIAKKGLIYYPDFCNLTAEWLRKDEDEPFHQIMFKVRGATCKLLIFPCPDAVRNRLLSKGLQGKEVQAG